jgi:ABC-2 type transport system permease protein
VLTSPEAAAFRRASWSPLNWGLDGFYKLFLRGGDVVSILPHSAKLLLFFLLCMAIVSINNRYKRRI